MNHAEAYGQLSSEVTYLVDKLRRLPIGGEARRLICRLAAQHIVIEADLADQPTGAEWIKQNRRSA